jgi:hypothetical protein
MPHTVLYGCKSDDLTPNVQGAWNGWKRKTIQCALFVTITVEQDHDECFSVQLDRRDTCAPYLVPQPADIEIRPWALRP